MAAGRWKRAGKEMRKTTIPDPDKQRGWAASGSRGGLQRRPVGGLSLHKTLSLGAGEPGLDRQMGGEVSRDDARTNVVGLRRAQRMKWRWGFVPWAAGRDLDASVSSALALFSICNCVRKRIPDQVRDL